MSDALLLLPDFSLILIGWFVCRHTGLNRPVWDGAERLVYYLLFPVLLFVSIVAQPMNPAAAARLVGCGFCVAGTGVALAYALGRIPGVDPGFHASGAQTAFRFNSYVALALSARLGSAAGVAAMAVLIACCVPLLNVAAVWPLARQGGQAYRRELARNPLIIATVSGLVFNLLGLKLPELVALTGSRIGAAALPLGLMAVGAGLRLGDLRAAPRLAAGLLAIRHGALPLVGLGLAAFGGLARIEQGVLVAFASLPTSSAAYVLAVRMGGQGGFVAGLVSLSTLIGMLGLPLSLAIWRALG